MSIWIIGTGGHASVVLDASRTWQPEDFVGALDDDMLRVGSTLDGLPVDGPISPETMTRIGASGAVIAIGSNRARADIVRRLRSAESIAWERVQHASAVVAPSAIIGHGVMLLARSVVQPHTSIGPHSIINTGAIIEHDGVIGSFVHIAPGATLCGNVTVGDGAFVGAGATVIPGVRIGAWATVGAGAVVVRDVPEGATVKGVPAR